MKNDVSVQKFAGSYVFCQCRFPQLMFEAVKVSLFLIGFPEEAYNAAS